MKRYLLALVLLPLLVACSSNDDDAIVDSSQPTLEQTTSGSVLVELEGYVSYTDGFTVETPDGLTAAFYLENQQLAGSCYSYSVATESSLSAMTTFPTDATFASTVSIAEGTLLWVLYQSDNTVAHLKMRVAYIDDNTVAIEYVLIDIGGLYTATDDDINDKSTYVDIYLPALNDDNLLLEHTITINGTEVVNYTIEYNTSMLHAQWVAFWFDKTNSQQNVTRTDSWATDPLLPSAYATNNSYHTSDGFDRGHLCASADRLYSTEANAQTFYYSNMSPQASSFNQGIWEYLELKVQDWGALTRSGTIDTLFVTKGGTLNNLLCNYTGTVKASDGIVPTTNEDGYTTKGLPCPAYYYMALLSVKNGVYNAIAFLLPHADDYTPLNGSSYTSADFKLYAISIDELEEATGEDFFANLPDRIERVVEANLDLTAWSW